MELNTPRSWRGKTLAELNVRAKYHVNIIAVRGEDEELNIAPGGDFALAGGLVVVLGRMEYINRLHDL